MQGCLGLALQSVIHPMDVLAKHEKEQLDIWASLFDGDISANTISVYRFQASGAESLPVPAKSLRRYNTNGTGSRNRGFIGSVESCQLAQLQDFQVERERRLF